MEDREYRLNEHQSSKVNTGTWFSAMPLYLCPSCGNVSKKPFDHASIALCRFKSCPLDYATFVEFVQLVQEECIRFAGGYCKSRGLDLGEGEEFVEERLLRIFKNRARSFKCEYAALNWLMKSLENDIKSAVRAVDRRKVRVDIASQLATENEEQWRTWDPKAPSGYGPDDILMLAESKKVIASAIARLSKRQRDVLTMIGDGADYEEIAARLCISVTSARVAACRGREQLVLWLQGHFPQLANPAKWVRKRRKSVHEVMPHLESDTTLDASKF